MTRLNPRFPPLSVVRESALVADSIPENEAPPMLTGGEALVRSLVTLGVDTYFGAAGSVAAPVIDAIVRDTSARLVEPQHETHAAFEAAGFHRATGRVPAVVVTAGPGATNVVTGVVSAHVDRVPMIVIVGDVSANTNGRRVAPSADLDGVGLERMLAGLSRGVFRVMKTASIAAVAMAAFERATDPRNRGPAVIIVPSELVSARCRLPAMRPERRSAALSDFPPSRDVLNTIAGRLRAAQRPLVFVGAGCRDASASVLQLIESMQCPFVTTPQAKGILPETHPLSLRNAGISSSIWARSYCEAGADFTLALGTDLDEASTAGTPPIGPGGTLVHVNSDPSIGRYESAFAIPCDVFAFAKTFRESVRVHGGSPVGHALAAATRSTSAFDEPHFDSDASDPIAPHRVIADLEDAVPADTTFVSDVGEHMLFALHYLTSGGLRRFVTNVGLGSMASGITASIGVALGDPSRTVVSICDDVGMQMAGTEILVAIEHRLPIVFAVFNGRRSRVDFAQWARAFGIRGARIERPGEIDRALLARLTEDGTPTVLDIRHDPNVRIGGDGHSESLGRMTTGLYPTRAGT